MIRHLVTESAFIGLVGGALGSVLAFSSVSMITALVPSFLWSSVPTVEPSLMVIEPALDIRVLSFALAASIGTGVLCGLAPAWRVSRPDLHSAMKAESVHSPSRSASRLHGMLVGTQVAVCMVLMVAAGLFLRGFHTMATTETDLDYEDVVVATVAFQDVDHDRSARFQRRLSEQILALPGVEATAFASPQPFTGRTLDKISPRLNLPEDANRPLPRPERLDVSAGFFSVLDIPILRG